MQLSFEWDEKKARSNARKQAISILSDQFLAEVRGLKYTNVAAELLANLLGDEIRVAQNRTKAIISIRARFTIPPPIPGPRRA